MIGLTFEAAWTTGGGFAAEGAEGIAGSAFAALGWRIVPIPVEVPGDEEIEIAVAVVVAPRYTVTLAFSATSSKVPSCLLW
jgi:hypothetical protein